MNRKLVIAATIVFCLGVIGLAIYGLFFKHPAAPAQSIYTDPGTGKQIIDNAPYTQTSADNNDPSRPVFIGFSTLKDRGLSQSQLDKVQNAVYSYSSQHSLNFKEISLTVNSIETTPPGSTDPGYYMRFMITVNRKDQYYIDVTYTDFTSCITHVYKADKTTLLFTQ